MRAASIALVLTAVAACSSVPADDDRRYVHAAYCAMGDRTTIHVTTLLRSHGIPSRIWGSLVYTVDVPEEDVDRARRILWDEAVRRPFEVSFDVALDDYTLAEPTIKMLTPKARREDLLRQPAYGATTDLGGALRHGEILKASRSFPFVVSVEVTCFEYLDEDLRYKTAHEFWIVLGKEPDEESHHLHFSARGGGQFVDYRGGFGTTYDDP